MEKEFYNCKYCFKEFEPKRRRVQKFCSDSCRSKNHHAKNITKPTTKDLNEPEKVKNDKPTVNKVEEMSLSGVGNAAIGSYIAKKTDDFLKSHANKPATKSDIDYLASKIKRYHKIVNLPLNEQRKTPYFDLETNKVIYSFLPLNG